MEEVYNSIIVKNQLTKSQKKGVLSLIYKGDGNTKNLNNWRPITLLCVDYKILARILANRLKVVLENLINPNQTGGLTKRKITDNLATIRNIILNMEKGNKAAILTMDFKKAYDRVERNKIYHVMEVMGLPDQFIKFIKILNDNSSF